MSSKELKTTLYIASIYVFRMLGLFMIFPIFSLYTHTLRHATPTLIGLALGVYGLTQGLLQIPFGMISDRIGRKPVILFGLILFIIGSIVAASTNNIYGIIIGRAIQGAGAIGSTLTALLADSTQEENRLKAMSIVGMSIGFSFMIAMVVGPIFNSLAGLSGIFWLTALLAAFGIIILLWLIPTPSNHFLHRDSEAVANQFKRVLSMPELLRLDFGIFASHCILTAVFIAIPIILINNLALNENHQWIIYLPTLFIAFLLMLPFVIIAEAKRLMKPIFISAIVLLTVSQLLLITFSHNIWLTSILLCLFFAAFTFLEASLPSLIAKIAPAGSKGTAMGIYSSSQFLGILVGGTVGGMIFHQFGLNSIFLFCGLIGLIWLVLAITMKQPPYLSSKIIRVGSLNEEATNSLQAKLLAISGVKEAIIYRDEQTAYLKIDKKQFSENDLTALIASMRLN